MTHLWEVDHPYYATEGNYFNLDCHAEFSSWADFIEEAEGEDMDYNLVYRWDWHEAGPDYELEHDRLELYYIGQRKALARSVYVTVTKDDEAAVIAWLKPRFELMLSLWEPFMPMEA